MDSAYINLGRDLLPFWPYEYETAYVAPVQLPHGATITRVTVYWQDGNPDTDATLLLNRNNMDYTYTTMSTVMTSGGDAPQPSSSYDDTIAPSLIDNSTSSYYLEWDTEFLIALFGVIIEYTFTETY